MRAQRPNERHSSLPWIPIAVGAAGILVICCLALVLWAVLSSDLTKPFDVAKLVTPTRIDQVIPSVVSTPKKTLPTETPLPTPTIPRPPVAKPLTMNSPEYGVQAFLWWRPETADRDVGLAKEAGLSWVKQQFAWRDIEGAGKGKFDWQRSDQAVYIANAKGADLLARLDNSPDWAAPGCFSADKKTMGPPRNTQDWVDFLQAFVSRYKGRVRAYEIWNEPNLAREWCGQPPNPKQYVDLLKASYKTIKAADPNAMIISAGLTPTSQNDATAMPDMTFLEKMYSAMNNNSSGYFDVLGLHAAGYKAPPEMSPDDVAKNPAYNNNESVTGRIYSFRHVEDMRKIMVSHGDSKKQVAILEFGWTMDPIHPAYTWFSVDEQTQGKYIVRAFQYAKKNWSPWIGAMFVIYLANPDWTKDNEEFWWAIDEPDGTPRAAWVQLKAMAK